MARRIHERYFKTGSLVEHDGAVFACDRYEPRWRLGRMDGEGWPERLTLGRGGAFAQSDTCLLTRCRS